jgi:tetratricopeptide (TPR) repeat protein
MDSKAMQNPMQCESAATTPRGWRFASTALCGFAVTVFAMAAVTTEREDLEKICVIPDGLTAATIKTAIAACTKLIDSDSEDHSLLKATHFFKRALDYMKEAYYAPLISDYILYFKNASADFDSALNTYSVPPDLNQRETAKLEEFVEMAKDFKVTTSLMADCFSSQIPSCTTLIDDKVAPNALKFIQLFKSFIFRQRGLAYLNRNEYIKAIADFNRTIEIFPKDALAFGLRAIAYAQQDQYGKSIADLNHAIGINDKSDVFFLLRGMAYMLKSQFQKAISDFDAALRINPKNVDAINHRKVAEQFLAQGGVSDRNRECAFRCGLAIGNCQNGNDLATAGGFMMGGINLGGLALGSMFHQNCGSQASCMQSCLSR